MKFISSLILALSVLVGFANAENPPITPTINGQVLTLTPTLPANTGVIWRLKQVDKDNWQILLSTATNNQPGLYDYKITISAIVSPEPIPPTPTPTPDPQPQPNPTPGPLFVLSTYETSDLGKLPPKQLSIINSQEIRSYLNTKCGKNENGLPEYRFFDKDANLAKESADWQKVWERQKTVRKSVPWITITNGKDTFDGPWPADVKGMLELLKKYGG